MKTLRYRIELLEPTLVTALEGDPNSAVAFSYLPGSVLRGALIGGYLRQQSKRELDAAAPDARRLFFSGDTRYLNGYPLDRQEQRCVPTPLSWRHEKEEAARQTAKSPAPVHDHAVEPPEDSPVQWQSVGAPFWSPVADKSKADLRLVSPKRHLSVHTARTRRYGRAMPQTAVQEGDTPGAVFRYDALAPGQWFEAVVLCDHNSDADLLRPLICGDVNLGGSRTGGYGRARLSLVQESEEWQELQTQDECPVEGELLVTLTSDALVRDEHGQYTTAPRVVAQAISEALGLGTAMELDSERTFIGAREIGGFNRKWGLPLPQALAVRMGSVLSFRAQGLAGDKLARLVSRGIGERRAEGFGRLAVNWQSGPLLTVEGLPMKQRDAGILPIEIEDQTSRDLAQQMVCRLLRKRLDSAVAHEASVLARHVTRIHNSQLSRLRSILHDALRQPAAQGRDRLRNYLEDLEKRATPRKQFTGDRIAGEGTVLKWLRKRVEDTGNEKDEGNIWKTLQARSAMPDIGGVAPALTEELAYEYNLRLVDAVLARAAKQRREGR